MATCNSRGRNSRLRFKRLCPRTEGQSRDGGKPKYNPVGDLSDQRLDKYPRRPGNKRQFSHWNFSSGRLGTSRKALRCATARGIFMAARDWKRITASIRERKAVETEYI